MSARPRTYDVVIVGAGAAGVGMAVTLRHLGIESFVVLDREAIGASFLRWPEEMRFITPSFNSNQFGTLDLNAVCLHTSPAYSLGVEHPDGRQYASYLRGVAKHFELPIETGVEVRSVSRRSIGTSFTLETSRGVFRSRFLVWAAGEFHYPRTNGFAGAELCLHNSKVKSWKDLDGEERIVIGGSESGIDAAVSLAERGVRTTVFDRGAPWSDRGADPSRLISPYTQARLQRQNESGLVSLRGEAAVAAVRRLSAGYEIALEGGETVRSASRPIVASGFQGSATLIHGLFAWRSDGFPALTEHDESSKARGLFLVGPQVRQNDVIFCFIYKFRQRFAVVANQIARRMKVSAKELESYRRYGMYLDDLSCCGEDCAC